MAINSEQARKTPLHLSEKLNIDESADNPPPVVWSIAGSDSGGGAGIQADLRAFNVFKVHGCTAVAALTAQNSTAVIKIEPTPQQFLEAQLAALAADMPPLVIKTGMLATVENIKVVGRYVDKLRQQNPSQPVALVVDPILRASTGAQFASDALRHAILTELLPRATLIKPNAKEAVWLMTGQEVEMAEIDASQLPQLAQEMRALGAEAVVITGGDLINGNNFNEWASDWLDTPQIKGWLSLPRTQSTTTHGTGCTFTASAAAAMALGFCSADAAIIAKMATTSGVAHGYAAGQGAGVVNVQPDFALDFDFLPYLSQELLPPSDEMKGFPLLQEVDMGLYPIVDSSDWVKRVIDAGATTVQLRIKADDVRVQGNAGQQFLSDEVKRSAEYARGAGVQFFVNDYWQLALEHKAYGVHLGQEDLPQADLNALRKAGIKLGVSTYALWEVCAAKVTKPSYYACGPIYTTHSKELLWLTQGEGNLAYWCKVIDRPVVAIGGIDLNRIAKVTSCGAKGLAVISAVTQAENPEEAIKDLQAAILLGKTWKPHAVPNLPRTVL